MADNSIQEMLSQLSQNYFDTVFKSINVCYFDLDCLFDFKLTALLQFISTETEYKYILSKIPSYNESFTRSIESCFPVLKVTNAMIDDFIADPKNHTLLSKVSLPTSVYGEIPQFIELIKKTNNKPNQDRHIKFIFNNRLFPYSLAAQHEMVVKIRELYSVNQFEFINTKYQDLNSDRLEAIDLFVLDNFLEFFKIETVLKLMDKGKFIEKEINTPMRVEPELLNDTSVSVYQRLVETIGLMNLSCNFRYLNWEVIHKS